MKIILIAAVGQRREIGKADEMIWSVPSHDERIDTMTAGHPVIMGRRMCESSCDLRDRLTTQTCIVLTHRKLHGQKVHESLYSAESVQEALSIARQSEGGEECFVLGGAEIYRQFLPFCSVLELTEVELVDPHADTKFPRWERGDFREVLRESYEEDSLRYHRVRYEKKDTIYV